MNYRPFKTSVAYLLRISLVILAFSFAPVSAQDISTGKTLEDTILEKDSLFWFAYNTCDLETMSALVSADLEFYHDKGGQTNGRMAFYEIMKTGLCRNGINEIERRVVPGTVKVFPIAGVGGIISGKHTFHGVKDPGEEGVAHFFQLWSKENGKWVMTRVFSYDHKSLFTPSEAITLSPEALQKFVGTYEAPQTGKVEVTATSTGLALFNGNQTLRLLPRSPLEFFSNDLPLVFAFTLDETDTVTRFSVLEKGKKVEEAVKQ